jgi:bifunctional DNA-binding transcriptional regulator/antitoxin component of YhaV-PrlF toxin-antitoxin module
MPRRRTDKKEIRKIQNSKRSYYITIPIEYIRKLGWRERQKVVVKKRGQKLTIQDWEG